MTGHDAFVEPNFCKVCKKHKMNCFCLSETLEEKISKEKEKSRQYAIDSFNNQENYND